MTNTGMAMGVQPNVPVYQQTMQEVQLAPVRLLSVNEELPTKQRVRFQGETFAQLKQRLVTAAVPGENVRVLVDDEWTVLLDEDALPNGDLHIRTMDAGTGKGYAIVFQRRGCCLCNKQRYKQDSEK